MFIIYTFTRPDTYSPFYRKLTVIIVIHRLFYGLHFVVIIPGARLHYVNMFPHMSRIHC